MTCIVEFCHEDCKVLPDDADVNRASGEAPCGSCGKPLRDHPTVAYPSGMGHCVQDCERRYWHL